MTVLAQLESQTCIGSLGSLLPPPRVVQRLGTGEHDTQNGEVEQKGTTGDGGEAWEPFCEKAGLVGSDRKEGHSRLSRSRAKCVPQLPQLIRTSLNCHRTLEASETPETWPCACVGGGVIPLLSSTLTQGQTRKRVFLWDRCWRASPGYDLTLSVLTKTSR